MQSRGLKIFVVETDPGIPLVDVGTEAPVTDVIQQVDRMLQQDNPKRPENQG